MADYRGLDSLLIALYSIFDDLEKVNRLWSFEVSLFRSSDHDIIEDMVLAHRLDVPAERKLHDSMTVGYRWDVGYWAAPSCMYVAGVDSSPLWVRSTANLVDTVVFFAFEFLGLASDNGQPPSPNTPADSGEVLPEIIGFSQPPKSLYAGLEGVVWLVVLVDRNGSVDRAKVARSSGKEDLDAAAIKASSGLRHKPGIADGRPVGCWVRCGCRIYGSK
jgi:TonB family protein